MAAYKSKINIEEENFEKNKSEMILLVDKMHDIQSRAEKISERRRPRFTERGQLTPRERLNALLDPEKPYVELWLTFIGLEKIEKVIVDRTLFSPEEAEAKAMDVALKIANINSL